MHPVSTNSDNLNQPRINLVEFLSNMIQYVGNGDSPVHLDFIYARVSASCALASFYDARRRRRRGPGDGRTDGRGGRSSLVPLPLSRRLRLSSDVIACPTEDFPEVACARLPARPPVRLYPPHAPSLAAPRCLCQHRLNEHGSSSTSSGTCVRVRRDWE